MEKLNGGITKENVRKFIEDLNACKGNLDRVEELICNHELVVAYLEMIGVNKDWLDNITVVEDAKSSMFRMVMDKNTLVTENGIVSDWGVISVRDGVFTIGKGTQIVQGEDGIEVWEGFDHTLKKSTLDEHGVEMKIDVYDDKKRKDRLLVRKDGKSYICIDYAKGLGKILRRKNVEEREDSFDYHIGRSIANEDMVRNMRNYPKYKAWLAERGIESISQITDILMQRVDEMNLDFSEEARESVEKINKYGKGEDAIFDTYRRLIVIKADDILLGNLKKKGMKKEERKESEIKIKTRLANARYKGDKNIKSSDNKVVIYGSRAELDAEAERLLEEKITNKKPGYQDLTDEERAYLLAVQKYKLAMEYRRLVNIGKTMDSKLARQKKEMEVIKSILPSKEQLNGRNVDFAEYALR